VEELKEESESGCLAPAFAGTEEETRRGWRLRAVLVALILAVASGTGATWWL
jgi:hypothetical protein